MSPESRPMTNEPYTALHHTRFRTLMHQSLTTGGKRLSKQVCMGVHTCMYACLCLRVCESQRSK